MMAATYVKGQHVGFVDRARLELPAWPAWWYVLQAQAGRDGRVIEVCEDLDVSAYSPTITRYVDRHTGREARAPHLGRKVVKRMLPGLIFVPDFDVGHPALEQKRVPYLEGWLQLGARPARLSTEEMQKVREIEAGGFSRPFGTRGQRRAAVGDRVRIVDGPLASFAARVEQLDSRGRLKVFVDALMRGVSVTLAETQVEPV